MEKRKSKSIQIFDIELLIELVKNQPQLYNSSFRVYRNKSICDELWKDIAGVMETDVDECKTAWTSLRSSYSRHLKNVRSNEMGINWIAKKHWYLADKLTFLYEHMQLTPYDRRLYYKRKDDSSTSVPNLEYKNENCTRGDSISIKSAVLSEISHSTCDQPANDCDDSMRLDESIDPDENYFVKKCPAEQTGKDHNILPPAKASEKIVTTREDSTFVFFQSILFDLRKLSDRKLRLFKQDILKDLNKYLDEDKDENAD